MRVLLLVVVLTICSESSAQELNCPDVLPKSSEVVLKCIQSIAVENKRIFADNAALREMMTALQQENERLTGELKKVKIDVGNIPPASVPTGIVAAFTTACPTGWREYQEASGRFVIGVGRGIDKNGYRSSFAEGETSGEYRHTLTYAEMPRHDHNLKTQLSSAPNPPPRPGVGAGNVAAIGPYNGAYPINLFNGEGEAHDIMPPYIALHFCLKI